MRSAAGHAEPFTVIGHRLTVRGYRPSMIEPERIELKAGEALEIRWADGRVDVLPATSLRDACSCAACRAAPVPLSPADPETCRITSVGIVGAYALNIPFAQDGRGTGIYPYP